MNESINTIQVLDKQFVPYIRAAQLQQEIERMATEMNRDYVSKSPLFISILNGSFMFSADLMRRITVDCEICFIKLASYRGVKSSGKVLTSIGLDVEIKGRDVIILEDIIDTGNTLNQFMPQLNNLGPVSVKIAALLHKPEALQHSLTIDYLGFSIPNKFVVGYGLDYDGRGRNIPEIYQLL